MTGQGGFLLLLLLLLQYAMARVSHGEGISHHDHGTGGVLALYRQGTHVHSTSGCGCLVAGIMGS